MVTQFLRKWTNSPKLPSLFIAAPALVPCPFSAPSRAVVVAPLLSLARRRLSSPAAVVVVSAIGVLPVAVIVPTVKVMHQCAHQQNE